MKRPCSSFKTKVRGGSKKCEGTKINAKGPILYLHAGTNALIFRFERDQYGPSTQKGLKKKEYPYHMRKHIQYVHQTKLQIQMSNITAVYIDCMCT